MSLRSASIAIATVLSLGAGGCSGCSTEGAVAQTDAAVVADARVVAQEAGTEAEAADAGCVSTFAVTADCVHPRVEASCTNGFCKIPSGCFVMGSPRCQPWRGANTEPEAQVTLTRSFEIAQHETTQGEWVAMGYPNPSKGPVGEQYGACASADCPVDRVSWFEALAYANARSRAHQPPLPECYELLGCTGSPGTESMQCTGVRQTTASVYECLGYRLPTDAEWEYAARAGTRTPFYGGPMLSTIDRCEREPVLEETAWYCHNVVDRSSSPVEKKRPNAWGLYDMLGNVFEFTTDEYTGLGPGGTVLRDPGALLGSLDQRPVRGGSVLTWPTASTASYRLQAGWNRPGGEGFRLVRTLP